MGLISPGTLASLKRVALSAMPDTCTIQRQSAVDDGAGGQTLTWATLSTPKCRVFTQKQTIQERTAEGRLENVVRWFIALPAGQDVAASDRIAANGVTYEVAGVQQPTSYEVERICQVEVLN